MASGRTHDIINYSTLTAISGGYVFLHLNTNISLPSENLASFVSGYLVGTLWITPDLDLAERTKWKVRVKKRWGKIGWLWKPYGKMFKHRGLSHTWFLGPMTRLIYLGMLVIIIGYPTLWGLAYFGIYMDLPHIEMSWDKIGIFTLFGYYFSQWLHLIADGVPIYYDITVWYR